MQACLVNRPDPEAMDRILSAHPLDAAGTIIRLAWREGLLREEIVCLKWEDIDFLNEQITLPNRQIPLLNGMTDYLTQLCGQQSPDSDFVVLSNRMGRPITPQHVSRLVRKALDEAGQTRVRLVDLRHDFVIRQLETHDWQFVSRITGIQALSLQLHFARFLPSGQFSTRAQPSGAGEIDEFLLWKLLHEESDEAAALTLRLTWQAGLYLNEITALTWGQVDETARTLRLSSGRVVELRPDLFGALKDRRRGQADSERIILSPRARQPMQEGRLSKLTRAALIRGGLDNLTLRDLRMDYELRAGGEEAIVDYICRHKSITRNELMALLQVSRKTAYHRLLLLTQRKKLVRIGTRYYLANTVIPPEKQRSMVLTYLQESGAAYRGDIAGLLHLEPAQCSLLLRRMVDRGEIGHEKQKYFFKGA